MNGYANKETWLVAVWLLNDESLYSAVRDILHASRGVAEHLGQRIKNYVEDNSPASGGMYGDMLAYFIQNVYWDEIAHAVLED